MSNDEAPKLHIDSDWKAEAQREKERLAAEDTRKTQSSSGKQPKPGELPPADFSALVGMLAYQAMSGLGGSVDPKSGKMMVDPEGSRFVIDLLAVLQDKTKGNLTEEESMEINQILAHLRNQFVQVMQLIAEQQANEGSQFPPPGSAPVTL